MLESGFVRGTYRQQGLNEEEATPTKEKKTNISSNAMLKQYDACQFKLFEVSYNYTNQIKWRW